MKPIFRFLILILSILQLSDVIAQGQTILRGIVRDKYSGQAIKTAHLSIIGGDRKMTASDGEFELNLYNTYDPGTIIKIFITHEKYGSQEVEVTLKKNLPIEIIEITQSKSILIVGTVRSEKSGSFIKGIQISPQSIYFSPGLKPPTFSADEEGRFFIDLPKSYLIKQIDYLELLFHDPKGRYLDHKETVNINSPLEISLEERSEPIYQESITVKGRITVDVPVESGRVLRIKADGNIQLGGFLGMSDPEGKDTGVFNIPIDAYNIAPEANHGSLIVRFSDTQAWQFCSKACEFEIEKSEIVQLTLDINDIKQENNIGAYEVELVVQ